MSGLKDSRILIVEDNLSNLKVLISYLNSKGLNDLTICEDGMDAWVQTIKAFGEKRPFDLIIADWMVPNLKGIDLVQRVRSEEGLNNTFFFMVSTKNSEEDIKKATRCGVNEYFSKPISKAVAANILKSYLTLLKAQSMVETTSSGSSGGDLRLFDVADNEENGDGEEGAA